MKFKRITRKPGCPECRRPEDYRVKREGVYAKLVSAVFNVRPHYCPNCDIYFFAPRHSKAEPQEPTEPVRSRNHTGRQLHPPSLTH
jgi:hypothetical protein